MGTIAELQTKLSEYIMDILAHICPTCKVSFNFVDFADKEARRKLYLEGKCQTCQDL